MSGKRRRRTHVLSRAFDKLLIKIKPQFELLSTARLKRQRYRAELDAVLELCSPNIIHNSTFGQSAIVGDAMAEAFSINSDEGFLARMLYDEEHVDYFACGTEFVGHMLQRMIFWSAVASLSSWIQFNGPDSDVCGLAWMQEPTNESFRALDAAMQRVENGTGSCTFDVQGQGCVQRTYFSTNKCPGTILAAARALVFGTPPATAAAAAAAAAVQSERKAASYKRARYMYEAPPSNNKYVRILFDRMATAPDFPDMCAAIVCIWVRMWLMIQFCVLAHACNIKTPACPSIWLNLKRGLLNIQRARECRELLYKEPAQSRNHFTRFHLVTNLIPTVVIENVSWNAFPERIIATLPSKIVLPRIKDAACAFSDHSAVEFAPTTSDPSSSTMLRRERNLILEYEDSQDGAAWEEYLDIYTLQLAKIDVDDTLELRAVVFVGAKYIDCELARAFGNQESGIARIVCDYCDAFAMP